MGFGWTDGLRLPHPDRLHINGKGNLEHILKFIQSELGAMSKKRKRGQTLATMQNVNAQLTQLQVPGLPGGSLDALGRWITASEMAVLAKPVIVPLFKYLRGLAEALASTPAPVICARCVVGTALRASQSGTWWAVLGRARLLPFLAGLPSGRGICF